jgi:hypothetical protein
VKYKIIRWEKPPDGPFRHLPVPILQGRSGQPLGGSGVPRDCLGDHWVGLGDPWESLADPCKGPGDPREDLANPWEGLGNP